MVPLKKEDIRSFSGEDLGGSAQWMVQVVFLTTVMKISSPFSIGWWDSLQMAFFIAYNPYKWSKINGNMGLELITLLIIPHLYPIGNGGYTLLLTFQMGLTNHLLIAQDSCRSAFSPGSVRHVQCTLEGW